MILLIAIVLILVGVNISTVNADNTKTFSEVSVHFEQNTTDRDVEVVFNIKGGDEGISKLQVTSPDGRIVIKFAAPDTSTLGFRQFVFESPEPKNPRSLRLAYPEGNYSFTGSTLSGITLRGTASLNHNLPPTVSFIQPKAEANNVQFNNLNILWSSVKNVSAYIIEIEQDEIGVVFQSKQIGASTSLLVPDGFLIPGMEYDLSIGTIAENGNASFIETTFKTAN